ncbi:glycosyltransferase [Paenibacillus sp. LMG 31456]|uniref:Glycosyltransferase n=1 Tax=Paenibacillus foliorum TaxID=2654974 RepID=A0A972K1B7_9BACL|nr:glycosyltransferase [Paenibacillus foliorum]NOU96534.1 glycosyltransferase [Paenibacillus foliorum]
MRPVKNRGAATGRAAGLIDGKSQGLEHGYHLGRCEAIRAIVPPAPVTLRQLRVLYIPQGFPAIDQGVIKALGSLVSVLVVGTPPEMLTAASQMRPDLVLVLNGLHVFPENHLQQIDTIRAMGIRTAIWFADDPYFTDDTIRIAQHYDVVFTHEQSCVQLYKEHGCAQVAYLPLAADTDLFRPQQVGHSYRSDVCFIGMAFWNRVAVFDRIAPYLSGKKVIIAGGLWNRLRDYKLLRHSIREGWTPVEETAKYYSGAKIVINLHRGHLHEIDNRNSRAVPGQSINPRTYEMAGCGSMQLTDIRDDLARLYTPGQEIAVYRSPEELMGQIEYYLRHEQERRTIAYNGLRRTLQQHTYLRRVEHLLQLLGY